MDDSEEWKAERNARQRVNDLIDDVAVPLVASGRATIAEAARLVGCSRQRLHEACRSYAQFSAPRDPDFKLGPQFIDPKYVMMQQRRWGHVKAKPIDIFDMTAPRREYLDQLWTRLVSNRWVR